MALLQSAKQFVANNIKSGFHDKRLVSLEGLKLQTILKRKNPYLFRAKAITNAPDMVQQLLDAHLSSNEETLFGEFLESMAIFVCAEKFGGVKSTAEGIDLEFSSEGIRYAVSIKSGPNWGNSRQISKMISDFDRIKRIAGHRAKLVCINGCCYGKDGTPEKEKGYLKLCGQDFWSLISGEPELYVEIVEPLGHQARIRCDEFNEAYGRVRTLFTQKFTEDFCLPNGAIDWRKLVTLNSGSISHWQA
jgi:hypothetical protein